MLTVYCFRFNDFTRIDRIDLSINSEAHRRLDADVEVLLTRFAQRADIF